MIRFDHISKKYPGTSRPALNDVDFEILRGEFIFLVGASGSGKSSCLRLMLKEDKPSKGKIHVLGHDLGSISNRKVPYFRRSLGVVFQDFRLLPSKTVYQNVAFTLQVIGKSRGFVQEAVPDVLKMVGLDGKAQRLPHELSGGEQQRVAIARAIVNKPQILLADEPTGNLDPATSAGIMQLLERINAGGTTVVMATHEAGFVDQMQRRVIELQDGQIVRDERHGGYGTTAAIPGLVRGSSKAAAPAAQSAPATASTPVSPVVETSSVPVTTTTSSVAASSEPTTSAVAAAAVAATAATPIAPAAPTAPAAVSRETTPQADTDEVVTRVSGSTPIQQPAVAPVAEPESPATRAEESTPEAPEAEPTTPEAEPAVPPAAAVPEVAPPQRLSNATGPIGLPARNEIDPIEVEHLSLAERLGLRAAARGTEDGEQNVGPTK
ncbi:cell division ATP-binding protein FtsE [Plantibacter sp. H53]|uniref:cell division ATP-binding protein FtsE n=1 Tax=unclassified Plantibacter TaxID=2624265 RepID=UPI0007D96AB6|nr:MULTISPECIES: cell division ATP-binding protein FtsE [unclassified Plantibacter]OAN29015.1 cell division ATP-binding protein FtsE [Plantibacter sp. H53]OII41017.1 cell division ATP-binding protein FtsE [Plantibacter sp. MMLR14_011]